MDRKIWLWVTDWEFLDSERCFIYEILRVGYGITNQMCFHKQTKSEVDCRVN